MKNLNISSYGVEEMTQQEMRETEGGIAAVVVFVIGAIVGGFLYDVLSSDHKKMQEEFDKGYQETRKQQNDSK